MPSDPDLAGKLHGLQEALHSQIDVLRNFAGELRPPALVKFGLESAIRSHLGGLGEKHPEIRTHLEVVAARGRAFRNDPPGALPHLPACGK